MKYYIVFGSSKSIGLELTRKLIKNSNNFVIGLSRTSNNINSKNQSTSIKNNNSVKTNNNSTINTVQTYHSNADSTFPNKCYNSDGAHGLITIRDTSGKRCFVCRYL